MSNQLLGLLNSIELDVFEEYLLSLEKKETINEASLIKDTYKLLNRPTPDFYNPLDLFHCHFILFNALHNLNSDSNKPYYIHIELTKILIIEKHQSTDTTAELIEQNDEKLASYYLDEENFKQASEEKIEKMLEDFKIKFQQYLNIIETKHCEPKTLNWENLSNRINSIEQSEFKNESDYQVLKKQFNQIDKYK